MNYSRFRDRKKNNVQLDKSLEIYWKEFKYRHSHYWKLFFRFSLVIVVLLLVPFIKSFNRTQLNIPLELLKYIPLLIVPLLSFFFSLLLFAEDNRLRIVHEDFKLLKRQHINKIPEKEFMKGIGKWVSMMFFLVFISLAILEYKIIFE